ncbi:uncharacterized protein [Ptychodera flava]|uniref:uncharacterized protein n=1 Tax=Ptychodera flava TaxID=63121 RepID=UPI00396A7AFA
MTVHIFGDTSSPSCANFALKKSSDNTSDLSVKNTISRNFYVDDMLKPTSTVTEGKTLAEGLIDTCKKSGFKLTKWISNTRPVLEAIPEEQRATEVKNLDLEQDDLPMEHALGMQWNVESDVFEFRNRTKEKPTTRRGILGVVSSLYDPLGMAAPALLPPKMLLQQLCKAKLGWDDDIPGKQRKVWEKWLSDLPKLEESFIVPRCIKPEYFGEVDVAQLHHFADASENGYGAVSYLRLIDKSGNIHSTLMMAKARVAPLKQISIPRLELTAATIAVRLNKLLRKEVDLPIDESVFWTKSRTVLRYINNDTTRFHTFVANRIAVIRGGSDPANWRYLNTSENPADECSRGQKIDVFLKNKKDGEVVLISC